MTKEEILGNAIIDWDEAYVNGVYLIPTDKPFEDFDFGFNEIKIIGYSKNLDKSITLYDFGSNHDIAKFMIDVGLRFDVETSNGLLRCIWNDGIKRRVLRSETVYSEFIISDAGAGE